MASQPTIPASGLIRGAVGGDGVELDLAAIRTRFSALSRSAGGHPADQTPTFCFNLRGWKPDALSAELAQRGLFTYHGNYYALGVMTALDLEPSGGAVRAGYLHYTTMEEADRLCDALASLA